MNSLCVLVPVTQVRPLNSVRFGIFDKCKKIPRKSITKRQVTLQPRSDRKLSVSIITCVIVPLVTSGTITHVMIDTDTVSCHCKAASTCTATDRLRHSSSVFFRLPMLVSSVFVTPCRNFYRAMHVLQSAVLLA